uniref:Uncharacterized protein n=1 Tax=Arundo donax TaxID=35708 RepID=A0A0A9CV34_ARUDO
MHEAEAAGEGEPEEARIAGVEDAEPVAAAAHAEVRPRLAVDRDHAAEVLRLPLRVDVGVVAGAVHEQGAVGEEVAVEQHQVPVERLAGGKVQRVLLGGARHAVRAHEPREDVDARQAHGVVVVPEVARRLPVGVREGRGGEVRARGGEAGGEPGQRVAVGGGVLHAAVEVDDGGDAAAGRRGGEGGVPREEVARGEVVGPRHVRGDALHGLDRGARHRGRLLAGAEGEDSRRREVAVEFPGGVVHADGEVAGDEPATLSDAVPAQPRHVRQLVDELLQPSRVEEAAAADALLAPAEHYRLQHQRRDREQACTDRPPPPLPHCRNAEQPY